MEALTKLANIFGKLAQPSPTPQESSGPNLFQNKNLPLIKKNTSAPSPRVHAIHNPRKPILSPNECTPSRVMAFSPEQNNMPQPHLIPPDDSSLDNDHHPTVNKNYNLRPRSRLYQGRLMQQYALAANIVTVMEANSVIHPNIGQSQEYRRLIKEADKVIWEKSFANKLGWLSQGVGQRAKGTNTKNTPETEVPFDTHKITYGKIVCNIKPQQVETHRTRLIVGGNLLYFSGTLTAPTATVSTAKCLFDSVVSTKNAKCVTADIKLFVLTTLYRHQNT